MAVDSRVACAIMAGNMERLTAPGFRDITTDLKDRLREAVEERDSLQDRVKVLDADIDLLMRMIEREQARQNPPIEGNAVQRPTETLPDFIFKALQVRPMSRDDLRHVVANAGYRVDGRHIHATTFNLKRSGRIVEIEDGVFASADSDLVKNALRAPSH